MANLSARRKGGEGGGGDEMQQDACLPLSRKAVMCAFKDASPPPRAWSAPPWLTLREEKEFCCISKALVAQVFLLARKNV